MYWEFTVYICDGNDSWEGYGWWPVDPTVPQLESALLEMVKSLTLGLNAHGFTQLDSLELTLQVVNPGHHMERRIAQAIRYRVQEAGGLLLRWQKVTDERGSTNGEG